MTGDKNVSPEFQNIEGGSGGGSEPFDLNTVELRLRFLVWNREPLAKKV